MKKLIFILCLFFSVQLMSQIPNGDWRSHLPLHWGIDLAKTPNKVFCAMKYGGMLSYDLSTGEIEKWTTVQGLSEIAISAIEYNSQVGALVIGYESGNIDVIKDSEILNFEDIVNKEASYTDKSINNIFMYDEFAYLACDFGIVVLNLEKLEFKDSYIFGESSSPIKTNDITIHNDYIYAATDEGLYTADINSSNLVDYNYWDLYEYQPAANKVYESVVSFNGNLIVAYVESSSSWDVVSIQKKGQEGFSFFNGSYNYRCNDISSDGQYLTISSFGCITVYNTSLSQIAKIEEKNFMDGIVYENTLFTAGETVGFSNRTFANAIDTFQINAPMYPYTGKIISHKNSILTSTGTTNKYFIGGIYKFDDDKWTTYNRYTIDNLDDVGNTTRIAIDPSDDNHMMVGTYQYGICEFQDNTVVARYSSSNTDAFTSSSDYAGGLAYDANNTCWYLSKRETQPLFVFEEGEWVKKTIDNTLLNSTITWMELLITSQNQIWALSERNGIVVLQENSDGSFQVRNFSLLNQEGDSYSRGYCLAEDIDGNIWVGTNSGPLEYTNVSNIFDQSSVTGYHVKIPRYDGTSYADLLLKGETINDVFIDGGNRKWFATAKSGAFLISEDGKETIHNFTTDDSPIFSNDIKDLGVQENTGEVFFSTIKGLVSYMGQATTGNEDFTDVYVYPNPVRPGYSGDITISGLIEDAVVKITDVSGNLVWETTSLGGQAVWDGNNFDGRRVASGVYLVMLSNEDGTKSHITKLLLLH